MVRDIEHINVNILGKGNLKVKKGIKLKDIKDIALGNNDKKHLCARINNEIKHLDYKVMGASSIEFLDIKDKDGIRVYIRTLSYVFIKACKDLYEECKISIEHSLSKGLYVEIHGLEVSEENIHNIKLRMKEIIESDLDINREKISKEEADKIFNQQNMKDKLRLSKYRTKEFIHVYNFDGLYDKFYGYLAPSTAYIDKFDLKYYEPGIIIQFPRKEENFEIPKFEEHKKLAKIFKEAEEWGEILDLGFVGALNDKIKSGEINNIIRVSEALHEKKIAYIADQICSDENIKVIMIAGPSSSGKTTFAERLSIQLRVNGKKPISISLDNYFVNRENTPRDENGEYDFESIDAIDIKQFNEDLINLMNHQKVRLPIYNFYTGRREYAKEELEIYEDTPIIIEGIHGLNEKLTQLIPKKNKFKIYISALTQLNIDRHNRIPTTDTRLIRRIVRDHKYRGNNAENTLKLWSSVRKGEEKNIFPFQEEADAMFNSALGYELAVLKKYAVPLLKEISRTNKYYAESKRLLKFLAYFIDIDDESVIPNTSIIKEFTGGSCFREE